MSKKNRGFYGTSVLTADGNHYLNPQGQKKKKISNNAFYFYMQDFRENQEARGIFYSSQKEVADAAASSWKSLAAEERKQYQDAAKEAKEKDKADLANKFTSQGKSYAQINKEEQEREQQQETILNEIQGTVRSLRTPAALNNYPFHLIHVNYYCKTTLGLYVPCELAVSEFTLMDGVKRLLHVLINPGDLPLGYRYECEKHSEETHKIPIPGEFQFEGLTGNYAQVHNCLLSFLRQAKAEYKLPPLYTVESQIEACESVLANLCDSVDEDNLFRVYPAKDMFFELQHACVEVFKPADTNPVKKLKYSSLAAKELDRDVLDYTKGISCAFHEETDAIRYCSLSCVHRWSFLILDFCHSVTKMPLIPGKHVPHDTNVSQFKKPKAVDQRKKEDNATKLTAAMQNMQVKSNGTNAWRQNRPENACALRPPKELSEAINLLSKESDEFPPLK